MNARERERERRGERESRGERVVERERERERERESYNEVLFTPTTKSESHQSIEYIFLI